MRRRLRIAAVALLALLELTAAGFSAAAFARPIGDYGFVVRSDRVTVAEVAPRSAAADAGITVGDRIVYATLPLRGRRFLMLGEDVPAGAAIGFVVVRDGHARRVTLRARPVPAIARTDAFTYAAAGLAVGIVGLLLVLLRPGLMTWAFALVAPPLLLPWSATFWSQRNQEAWGVAFDAFVALLYAVQTWAIMIFASRFPNDRAQGIARLVDRTSLPIAILVAGIFLAVDIQVRFAPAPPIALLALASGAVFVPGAAALLALISTFASTPGSARTRIVPVLCSLAIFILTGIVQQLAAGWTSNEAILVAVEIAFSASPALVAAAVAYGVVRHRVMDVRFIVSRTLVYTTLTLIAVVLFALIEYVFGRLLERQGVATILNLLAAVGLGVSFNLLHARLDDWIERLLFRRRHLAESRLAASARALAHASSDQAIDQALVDEPAEALALASAAVFRRKAKGFRRARAVGWRDSEAGAIDADDPLALQLQADLQAIDPHELGRVRTDLPDAERQVIYAVPIAIGHRLAGFALYGAHSTGEGLDPNERHALRALARSAAAAYDHVATQALRLRLERAEREIAVLRAVERKLADLLRDRA